MGVVVCVYVSQRILITRYLELEDLNLECMWSWARPPRLPRPLSAIAVCVVYNPPDKSVQEQRELCVSQVKATKPNVRHLIRGRRDPPSRTNEHNCNLRYGDEHCFLVRWSALIKTSFFHAMCLRSHN